MINNIQHDDGSEPVVRRVRVWPHLRRACGSFPAVAGDQVSTCARIRLIGDMGLTTVKGDFPGTSAWRPPTC